LTPSLWPTLLWVVPLGTAALIRWVPSLTVRHVCVIAASAINLVIATLAAWEFREGGGATTLSHAWVWQWADGAAGYHATVDAGNVLFLPLTALLALLVAIYGLQLGRKAGLVWHSAVLMLQACIFGQLVSADMLVYGVFAAAEIVPMTRLVGRWGTGAHKAEAARRVGVTLGFAVALWACATGVLALLHLEETGRWSTDVDLLARLTVPHHVRDGVFLLMIVALGTRAALFPLHGWLVPATAEGPVAGLSVLLLGVKVGIAGILRILWPILPEACHAWSDVLRGLGAVGLVYGALLALGQTDLRRMLGYFAVAHTGFVILGLFSGEVHGVSGALLEAFNLGVAAAGMYFAAGFLWLRARSTEIEDVRPIASAMPKFGLVFLVTALTGIGMPGTLGFEAIHLEIEGSVHEHAWGLAVLEAAGTVLFAVVLLSWYQRLFLTHDGDRGAVADLRPPELLIAGALTAIVFAGGLNPTPWVESVEHNVAALLHLPDEDLHGMESERAPPHGGEAAGSEGAP
jgi:NADH-quinone oxidoreductase subunit M